MQTEELKKYLFDFDNSHINNDPHLNNENLNQDLMLTKVYWEELCLSLAENNVEAFFTSMNEEKRELYFQFGIECIVNFVRENFTGPKLTSSCENFLNGVSCSDFNFKDHLSVDGEEINVNTKHSALLCLALVIFKRCQFNAALNLWWHWRALIVHQQILDELSPKLLAEADELHKKLESFKFEPHLQALLALEQAQLYQMYRHIVKSEEHLNGAKKLLGINYELLGALGKRTKYQENSVAQLQLSVKVDKNGSRCDVEDFPVPKNLALEDDVRLDTIKFNSEPDLPTLTDLEQKYLILSVNHMIISQPRDNLYYEEIKPFLDYLLNQKNTWAARAAVLLMRCKFESSHKRTIERCLLQCDEIVLSIVRTEPPFFNRVSGVFCTQFPPVWRVEEELGKLMLNTGMVKASLDIYLKLQLWEEVIVCYTLLKMRHKATEIIRERLDANPTVKLWCLLGDSTDDANCYETAWKLSRHRSGRAQRHWAEHLYYRKQYLDAIPHFEESLRINPLQVSLWLHYGFAALETENWQKAVTAYKRYTSLEPGNFEAWNNLAKSYIKLKNKHAAHQALHDAIKCNFDNWKVWDNLMVVSVDVKAFADVINAYHRILDVKGKHVDVEVLQALVFHVTSTSEEPNLLLKRAQELLGRITGISPLEGAIWELYAELASDQVTHIQRLQRALRAHTSSVGWEKDINRCGEVLRVSDKLGKSVLNEERELSDLLINNVRLSIAASLSAIKKQEYNSINVDDLNLLLEEITKKCKSLKL